MSRQPLTTITGPAAPLLVPNVDTDVIIRVERMTSVDPAALAPWAFESIRYHDDGSERADFSLNQDPYRGAPILLAGRNFGCGSSREPAALAIKGLGVRCVIAPSFGDIFRGNCTTNGVLAIILDEGGIEAIAAFDGDVTVDLPSQTITAGEERWTFAIASLQKTLLVGGLDELDLCLRHADDVARWEDADQAARPWAWRPPRPAEEIR